MTSQRIRRALLGSAAISLCLTGVAYAQAEEPALVDEITITAQKREQSVYDVGGTLAVAGAETLQTRRVEQVKDLATLTPNVDVKEQVPGAMPIITIRGVGLDDFSSANNPSAGVYIDEVYLASLAQMNFDFFDIDRVELLKGPQGTLYGRNSTAGALNVLTAKPSFGGFAARAAAGIGNYESYEAEGMVNIPVSDSFALRIAAKTIGQDEGFWFNRVQNRDIGRRDVWLGRVQARWAAGNADVTLKLEGQRVRSEMGQGEFMGVFPSALSPTVACPGDPRCTDFFGYRDPDGDPFKGDWSGDQFYDIDQWGATLRAQWDLGFATLTSVTGWQDFERSFYIDTDATPLRQTDFIQNDAITQFSQELRLAGDTDKLNWLVGAFYSSDDVDTDNPGFLQDLFNTTTYSFGKQETQSAALFGNGEWALAPTLSLVAGLRYTWEEKAYEGGTDDLVSLCPGSALTGAPCGAGPIRISFIDETISDTNWSYKLGLNWKPAEDLLVYASVSQGVKSGGFFSGVTTNSGQLKPYDPETLVSFEAGVKARLGGGVQVAASVFHYDYSDVQTFIRDTSGALPIQRLGNVDEAKITGLDADLTWRPPAVDGLTIQLGLGLLDAELGEFAVTAGTVPKGNRLPNAPEVTFNASGAYDIPLGADWSLQLQGGAKYSDSVFKDAINDPLLVQDSYWMFDGRIGVSSEGGWSFSLWGKNLSDEQYVVQGVNNGALGVGFRTYNAPRTFGVTVAKRW
jgi:iron complex outermembrane recepter protein